MPESLPDYCQPIEEGSGSDVSDLIIPDSRPATAYPEENAQPKQESKSLKTRLDSKLWIPGDFWERFLLFSSFLSAFLLLFFECFIFGLFTKHIDNMQVDRPEAVDYDWRTKKRNAVATYLALYIYAEIYQLIYTCVIFYTKNIYHLVAYFFFLCAMAVYSGIQYYELKNTLFYNLNYDHWQTTCKAFSIVVIALSCAICVIQATSLYNLRSRFVKLTGEKVGNRTSLIHSNIIFNLHRTALIMGVFFFPAFTLQFAVIVLSKSDPEFIITIIILALSYLILLLADYSAVREYIWGFMIVIPAYMAGMAYLAFKLYRLFTRYVGIPGRRSLVAFDIFCIVLLLWLMILTPVIIYDFGRGLKQIYSSDYHSHKSHNNEVKK